MLKIRYDKESRLLTGWGDDIKARKGEGIAILLIDTPPADDYEYFCYKEGILQPSGKQSPIPRRNLEAEIDSLQNQLDTLDSKVRALEKL